MKEKYEAIKITFSGGGAFLVKDSHEKQMCFVSFSLKNEQERQEIAEKIVKALNQYEQP